MAAVKLLVAGASGFVGRRLCPALTEAGHEVIAMTRNPAGYAGPGVPVCRDVHDPDTLDSAMAGCQAAFCLVHSLDPLPAMITPRWVATRTQPIAVDDVVRYLLGVLTLPEAAGQVFEAGGPEVLQYITMLRRVAALKGRRVPIIPVPLLTPWLSSLWLTLVTDVDTATGRALVGSMTNEVVVRDQSSRDLPSTHDLRRRRRQALGERVQEA